MKRDGKKETFKVLSDIKLGDNATITVVPNPKGKEEGDGFSPFKSSKRLQRSPIVNRKMQADVSDESERVKYCLMSRIVTRVRRLQ